MTTNVFDVGDVVASTKALRQDGTHPEPGVSVGDVLVPPGTRGEVLDVGIYLQEHIVYAVAFTNGRVVGCLERELESVTASASSGGAAAKAAGDGHEGGRG